MMTTLCNLRVVNKTLVSLSQRNISRQEKSRTLEICPIPHHYQLATVSLSIVSLSSALNLLGLCTKMFLASVVREQVSASKVSDWCSFRSISQLELAAALLDWIGEQQRAAERVDNEEEEGERQRERERNAGNKRWNSEVLLSILVWLSSSSPQSSRQAMAHWHASPLSRLHEQVYYWCIIWELSHANHTLPYPRHSLLFTEIIYRDSICCLYAKKRLFAVITVYIWQQIIALWNKKISSLLVESLAQ